MRALVTLALRMIDLLDPGALDSVDVDVDRWFAVGEEEGWGWLPGAGPSRRERLEALLWNAPAYRTLLYHRLRQRGSRRTSRLLALMQRTLAGPPALEIACPDIAPGLYIAHGFATIIVADRIGRDCRIHQNVTLGWKGSGRAPRIGDRVSVFPGAVVVGDISVGDDAVIGANAVVVKDVPAGDVVGGVPAKSLRPTRTRPILSVPPRPLD